MRQMMERLFLVRFFCFSDVWKMKILLYIDWLIFYYFFLNEFASCLLIARNPLYSSGNGYPQWTKGHTACVPLSTEGIIV